MVDVVTKDNADVWNPKQLTNFDADSKSATENFTAFAGQSTFTLTTFSYTPNTQSLTVYAEAGGAGTGLTFLQPGEQWVEKGPNAFALLISLAAGAKVSAVGLIEISDPSDPSELPTDFLVTELTIDIGALSDVAITEGYTVQSLYYSTGKIDGSGAYFKHTGVSDLGKAGDVPNADGKFYDADGKQFEITDVRPNVLQWGAVGNELANDYIPIQTALDSGNSVMYAPQRTRYLIGTGLIVPNGVMFVGDGKSFGGSTGVRGTEIRYDGAGVAITYGTSTSIVNRGCALIDMAIELFHDDSIGVKWISTVEHICRNVWVQYQGSNFAARTGIGMQIDGSNISSFQNYFESCNMNHMHIGYQIMSSGSNLPTQQIFMNCGCAGDFGAGDVTSIGYDFIDGGDATTIQASNVEDYNIGLRYRANAKKSMTVAMRFEANNVDIQMDAGADQQSHIAPLIGLDGLKFVNNSSFATTMIGALSSTNYSFSSVQRMRINDSEPTNEAAFGLGVQSNQQFTDNLVNDRFIRTDADETSTKVLGLQAGQGTNNHGAGIIMNGHAHAVNPGGLLLGISGGSGGTVQIRDQPDGTGNVIAEFDLAGTTDDTSLFLWDVSAASLVRVTRGIVDSGGAGFRLLRVPN